MKRSIETRRKISAARKGRPAHNKGKPHPAEVRAKISAALKRLYASPKAQEDHRVVQRVIQLFRPEIWAEKIEGNRERMRARLRDPAFQALAAAGRKAARERRAALEPVRKAADRKQMIADMLADGMKQCEIARRLNVSPQRVSAILKVHGVAA